MAQNGLKTRDEKKDFMDWLHIDHKQLGNIGGSVRNLNY